jgi:cell division transport system permease protein
VISILRIIKFALQNFWRNIWLSIITISMLVLTLLTVNVLVVLTMVTDTAIRAVEEKIDVSIYFEAGTPEETVKRASAYLQGLSQVRDALLITPEEGLERFRERHASDEAILSSLAEVGENPIGYTLVVRAHDADDFPFILEAMDSPAYRDTIRKKDFSNYTSLIERLTDTTNSVRTFGLVLSGIFLAIAVLIIFNTVRVTIFIHREEIAIMKLVGATNGFVRAPFILEAFLYSAVATVISTATMFPVAGFLEPKFRFYFEGVNTNLVDYFAQNGWSVFGGEFVGLVLVSVLSTAYAMRRYLRV